MIISVAAPLWCGGGHSLQTSPPVMVYHGILNIGPCFSWYNTEVQGLSFVGSTSEVCWVYALWNIQNLGANTSVNDRLANHAEWE